jgi:uncharacterized protein (TIGR02246 family)
VNRPRTCWKAIDPAIPLVQLPSRHPPSLRRREWRRGALPSKGAAWGAGSRRADIVRLLLDAGEDPNRYNPDGLHSHSTPLHQAALAGHDAVVRLLVERGARLDILGGVRRADRDREIPWRRVAMIRELRRFLPCLLMAMTAGSTAAHAQSPTAADVIAVERAALDRWGHGDPQGFLETYAPEVTYFDPSQEKRVDGLEAMRQLIGPLAGKIKVDRYEMLNPKVQSHGDVAVLTYNVVNYARQPDGSEKPTTRWNSTSVYRRIDGRWRMIHSHWSFTKPELKAPPTP